MRKFPEVRALCARARRPAIKLLIGTALIAPAATFMARAQVEGWELEAGVTAQTVSADDQARSAVADAWRAKVLERERQKLTAQFAAQFDIPFDLADEIHWAALQENVDPQVAFGLVRAESSFRTAAVSPVGAIGLTQLLPSTAKWLVPETTRKDLLEPRTNLRVGFRYLRHLLDEYDGNTRLALTAYNRGPGTVDRLLKSGRNPENGYADMVLTGRSDRHVALMNRKFGRKKS
jgi:soluble lytic murein transglycosylase-like protein